MIYRTYFRLTDEVNDFDDAEKYLTEDDMVKYLSVEDGISQDTLDNINAINWHLTDVDSGYIELITNKEINQDELDNISDWVSGQNSDGLGEGFEQQDFANYPYEDTYDDEEPYWVMASFDWQTNDYKFELYQTN